MFWRESWPTKDKIIPWKLFRLLFQGISHLRAADRLDDARSAALGIGLGLSGEKTLASKGFKDELELAFPEEARG